MTKYLVCGLIALCGAALADDILIADFEGADYGNWKVEGDAFGNAPAHGTLPNQMQVSGFQGKGFVNSYVGGDGTQGKLTSPEFTIERKYINMLVGGGCHPKQTCANLIIDGSVARTLTGRNSEALYWQTWNVAELNGKTAHIEIVDKSTVGWGHINIDQIVQSDERKQEEIMTSELYNETYRPQFHFSAKKNWLNDPNGLVFYAGEYHLFFQYNPFGIEWGNMHWNHAVSKDLVHWEELPIALEPDAHGTCFSGSAVIDWNNSAGFQTGDEKVLVAIYTGAPVPEVEGGPKFTQCLAYSNDRGRTWTKYDKNPVLEHIIGGNRDPKVQWHAPSKQWVMALYLDKQDYALFGSKDLKSWARLCDVHVPDCSECPDFFELHVDGDAGQSKWLFLGANGNYLIGTFDGKTFKSESGPHRGDYGANFYAIQSYSNIPEADGRRIQIAWMNGGKYPEMPFNQQMSFPCELTLRTLPEGLRVCRWPVREIEGLRDQEATLSERVVGPDETIAAGIKGELLDIEAEFALADAPEFGLKVRGEEVTYSAKDATVSCLGKTAPLKPVDGRIRLRVLADRTSLEVFGNGGAISMSSCFLPRSDERSVEAFARGGKANVVSLCVHTLRSAWLKAK